jgi:NAD(P)-dependent dehydrogenase (short-subunit alcohol dehydrogenase family)
VVNCAGIQFEQMLHEVAVEDWDDIMATNLRGYFLVSKHAVASFLNASHPGALVHISSGLGLVADQMLGPYSVTKAGQILLSHALAVAYGQYGIRSNAICPGSTATSSLTRSLSATAGAGAGKHALLERWYPHRRITEPREVAAVAWMLASDEASAVSGAVVNVDGGFHVMAQHNMMYSEEIVRLYEALDAPSTQ